MQGKKGNSIRKERKLKKTKDTCSQKVAHEEKKKKSMKKKVYLMLMRGGKGTKMGKIMRKLP